MSDNDNKKHPLRMLNRQDPDELVRSIEAQEAHEEKIRAHISDELKKLTKKSGLTQAEIARRAGQQRDSYGRYLLGRTTPPLQKLVKIAQVFGVEVSEIDPFRDYSAVIVEDDEEDNPAFSLVPSAKDPEMVRVRLDVDLPLVVAADVMKLVSPYRA